MLELKGIEFSYKKEGFNIAEANFQADCGTVTLIAGSNGEGKSTLAKILAGILKPEEGDILLDGESIKDDSLAKIGKRIAYLFQEPANQLFAVTPLEELTFVEVLKDKNLEEAREKAIQILKTFQLDHLLESSVVNLSRGEKQRLAISALLMNDPDYFILDEPTSGLDRDSQKVMFGIIEELLAQGKGIVLISHDKEFVQLLEPYISKRIVMKGGRVIG